MVNDLPELYNKYKLSCNFNVSYHWWIVLRYKDYINMKIIIFTDVNGIYAFFDSLDKELRDIMLYEFYSHYSHAFNDISDLDLYIIESPLSVDILKIKEKTFIFDLNSQDEVKFRTDPKILSIISHYLSYTNFNNFEIKEFNIEKEQFFINDIGVESIICKKV